MKKIILSLGLLASAAAAANAQVAFGVKAGASLTNFTGDIEGNANKLGLHAGVLANLPLGDVIAIQPEVLFSMKGTQDKNESKNKFNYNYIDIPVLLQYKAEGLFFEAGPQLGILASAKLTDGTNDVDLKDVSNTIDFGYVAGLGYKLDAGLVFDLRYNGGITSVAKEEFSGSDGKVRNSAFQFSVGYLFGGK